MRERIDGLTDIIRQVLEIDRSLHWEEVCDRFKERTHLMREQQEITYGRPNYQHSVRRTLSYLVERGKQFAQTQVNTGRPASTLQKNDTHLRHENVFRSITVFP